MADPSSGFNPVQITVQNGNEILLNYEGIAALENSQSVIDITTVPEPSTLVLLGVGAIGLLSYAWRWRHV